MALNRPASRGGSTTKINAVRAVQTPRALLLLARDFFRTVHIHARLCNVYSYMCAVSTRSYIII